MNLQITNTPASGKNYLCGEVKSLSTFKYGHFEVRMKPAKSNGIVSSFFVYTYTPQHDKIDIEFLGKDTTKAQLNYFVAGVGGHEHLVDLGFDASLDYHVYEFTWSESKITWCRRCRGLFSDRNFVDIAFKSLECF